MVLAQKDKLSLMKLFLSKMMQSVKKQESSPGKNKAVPPHTQEKKMAALKPLKCLGALRQQAFHQSE
jgi:hypothetical protein